MERNQKTGDGPWTLRGVARAIAEIRHDGDPSHSQIEDYRRALRRYMSEERTPTEKTLELVVRATGASREDFPPRESRESRLAGLRRQLAELEDENRQLRERLAAAESERREPSSGPSA